MIRMIIWARIFLVLLIVSIGIDISRLDSAADPGPKKCPATHSTQTAEQQPGPEAATDVTNDTAPTNEPAAEEPEIERMHSFAKNITNEIDSGIRIKYAVIIDKLYHIQQLLDGNNSIGKDWVKISVNYGVNDSIIDERVEIIEKSRVRRPKNVTVIVDSPPSNVTKKVRRKGSADRSSMAGYEL